MWLENRTELTAVIIRYQGARKADLCGGYRIIYLVNSESETTHTLQLSAFPISSRKNG